VADLTQDREETARRIRMLRKSRELSIQKLAKSAGISQGYLSEIERGRSAVSGEKLARIAEQLGVTADYLLSGRTGQSAGSAVNIPPGLSEAAEVLDLSFAQTLRLLAGKESLVARRSTGVEQEWTKDRWIDFYQKVKPYL
jgi:transcriptional regulator with XRE-family HTH domain